MGDDDATTPKFKNPKKRGSSTSGADEALASASKVLESLAERNSIPDDIRGFTTMLGADLLAIDDIKRRKVLMHDIHSLVLKSMFEEDNYINLNSNYNFGS